MFKKSESPLDSFIIRWLTDKYKNKRHQGKNGKNCHAQCFKISNIPIDQTVIAGSAWSVLSLP